MANEKPNLSYSDFYTFNSDPTANVNPTKVGVVWINNKDKKIFLCTDNSLNKNKWEQVPNMELLEGKVEDALKELEDMSQEIRTYASGLEYVNQGLISEKTYSWKHDVELELSPELYIDRVRNVGNRMTGMEMQFYINGKYHPVTYCGLSTNYNINSIIETRIKLRYIYQAHLSAHRASFGAPYDKDIHGNNYEEVRYIGQTMSSHSVLRFISSDYVDLENISEIRTSPYTCKYAFRGISDINGTSNYGVPIDTLENLNGYTQWAPAGVPDNMSDAMVLGWHIPWYIYYGGETSLTDYWPKIVTPAKIDKDILIRIKMMLTGVPYTIKLKAGETFRFRVRLRSLNNAWDDWTSSAYLPVGYMAPKLVTYIN